MNRFANRAIISLIIILFCSSQVFPCRCVEPSPRTAYKRAEVVVIGKVLKVTPGPSPDALTASLSVSRAWKGDVPAEITMVSGEDCLYKVAEGQEHILYLAKGREGSYGTIRCRGNKSLSKAKQALEWLRRYGRPARVVSPQ